jgi:hypothetical protein
MLAAREELRALRLKLEGAGLPATAVAAEAKMILKERGVLHVVGENGGRC